MNISFLNSLLKFQPKNPTLVEEKETITLDDSDENISRMQKEDFERLVASRFQRKRRLHNRKILPGM